jgi:hypothetical protein
METLNVSDIVARGLGGGFESLAPRERDVFVVFALDQYLEMEGTFGGHLARAPEEFNWLLDTLNRIGDLHSQRIIDRLCKMGVDADGRSTAALYSEYEARQQFRWSCLERYFAKSGDALT